MLRDSKEETTKLESALEAMKRRCMQLEHVNRAKEASIEKLKVHLHEKVEHQERQRASDKATLQKLQWQTRYQ